MLPLQIVGKIDVEEEFQQTCFHITVYKSYVPEKPPVSAKQTKSLPRKSGRDVSELRFSGVPGQIAMRAW